MADANAERRALLDKLKIDRGTAPQAFSRAPARWPWLLAGVAVLALLGWYVGRNGSAGGPIPVSTDVVSGGPSSAAASVLDASGYVIARRQATVSAKVTGKVVEVLIEEGMRVNEGQVMARLDDSIPRGELALAEAQLIAARAGLDELDAQLRQARLDEQRARELAVRKLGPVADADRSRLARENTEARIASAKANVAVRESALAVQQRLLDDLTVRAPFAGVVVAKAAQPGEMISPISAGGGFTRTGIGTLVDMDSLEVEVDVTEANINRVRAEQPVDIVLNAYPDAKLPGKVIAIIPTADRNKATVRVRIALTTADPRVLPDMGVKVSFLEQAAANAPPPLPSVPTSAIRSEGNARYVFVVGADNRLVRREVTTAAVQGDRTSIRRGLTPGERVLLGSRDGSDIRFSPEMEVAP